MEPCTASTNREAAAAAVFTTTGAVRGDRLGPGPREAACSAPPPATPAGSACVAASYARSASAQGLTLVHFSAQLERFVWDEGCA